MTGPSKQGGDSRIKDTSTVAGISFDYTESSESRRRRKLKNLQNKPGTKGEGDAAGDALKKLPTGPTLPKV